MDAPERWAEIMRLQAALLAAVQTLPTAPGRPGDKGVTPPEPLKGTAPTATAPTATAPRPRYHKGHFGPQHGLTPAQAWQAEQLLRQKKPFRGPHKQQKEASRIRGIISAVKAGRVGNRRWGRSMLGKLGGKAMRDHALGHLRAIARLGGEGSGTAQRSGQPWRTGRQPARPCPSRPRKPVGLPSPPWRPGPRGSPICCGESRTAQTSPSTAPLRRGTKWQVKRDRLKREHRCSPLACAQKGHLERI